MTRAVNGTDMTVPAQDTLAWEALDAQEAQKVQARLERLLARHVARYTMGDSSSIPMETAQELLASICYTLNAALAENDDGPRGLLAGEGLEELFAKGYEVLERHVREGQKLWIASLEGMPAIESRSLHDTLRGIGSFFDRYDLRFFAHEIPCDHIDYQLCRPVPDTLLGIAYVNEYLRRVIVENSVLGAFRPELTAGLLKGYCPDYEDLLVNLCEPVAACAIGLVLAGGEPFSLNLTDMQRRLLMERLADMDGDRARIVLACAARRFCGLAGIADAFAQSYLERVARDLYPRIRAALSTGSLEGIFQTLPMEGAERS